MAVRIERPFPLYAVPRVWQWIAGFRDRVADDFSPKTLDEFVARWQADDARGRQTWQVIRDEELGGVITSTRLSPVLADLHCIFKRSFWGHDTTVTALRMACEEMFDDGVLKFWTLAFKSNHALIGIVKALGGKTEGVSVGHTLQGGKPVDVTIIGISREGFYESRSRVQQQHHQKHEPVLQSVKPERDQQHQPQPDAVPVGESGAAVQLHQQPDDEPERDHRAVPESGAKRRKQQLQRVV